MKADFLEAAGWIFVGIDRLIENRQKKNGKGYHPMLPERVVLLGGKLLYEGGCL